MSRSKALAVAFYLGAVVIGAAAGIAVDRKLVRDPMIARAQNPRAMADRFFADLGFTAQQRTAWDSIGRAAQRADSILVAPIRALGVPLRPQRDSLMRARDEARRGILTPEQRQLLDERNTARRQRSNDSRR